MDADVLAGQLKKARMTGAVIDRGHNEYDKYRRIWNGVADRRPAAIMRARSVEDVIPKGVSVDSNVI